MFNAVPIVSHPQGFKRTDYKERAQVLNFTVCNTAPKSLHEDYSQTEYAALIQEKKILLRSLNYLGSNITSQTGLEHTPEIFVSLKYMN